MSSSAFCRLFTLSCLLQFLQTVTKVLFNMFTQKTLNFAIEMEQEMVKWKKNLMYSRTFITYLLYMKIETCQHTVAFKTSQTCNKFKLNGTKQKRVE